MNIESITRLFPGKFGMANSDPEVLKILCIHGYRQNAQSFRERTGAFRKIIKKRAELVFISAPNRVPPLENQNGDVSGENGSQDSHQRGWWFSRSDDYFLAQEETECCKGYEESLEVVKQAIKEQGPFDGILGFSQGAALVALILGIMEQEKEACPFQFDFAIMVASFKSRSTPHQVLYTVPITMPTLHVFGDTDKVIPKDMSEDLVQHYINPIILQHPGGHFIPASGPQKKVYLDFLQEMLAKKKRTVKL